MKPWNMNHKKLSASLRNYMVCIAIKNPFAIHTMKYDRIFVWLNNISFLSLSSPSCILWRNFLEGFTSSSSLKGTIVDEWDFMWIYFTIPKQIASKRSNLYILFWMNKRTRKSRSRALCEGTDAERNWNNCLILYVNTPPSESERRTFIRQGSKEIKIKWNSQKSSRNFSQGSQFTPYCKPSCW